MPATTIDVFEYNGSLLGTDLLADGRNILLGSFSGAMTKDLADNDGRLEASDNGVSTLDGQPVTYIGEGTATPGLMLGDALVPLGASVRLVAFQANDQVYFHYPEGTPGLVGAVALGIDIAPVAADIFDNPYEGTAIDEHFVGDDFDNDMRGNEGDDTLDGGLGDDVMRGGAGDDTLDGQSGADVIAGNDGNDVMRGGDGNDLLFGGGGSDLLFGDSGADVFIWNALPQSKHGAQRDTIADFEHGVDKIDLGQIMPNMTFLGDVGVEAYTGTAGELRYNSDIGRLYLDSDGDGASEFSIDLDGATMIDAGDLIL